MAKRPLRLSPERTHEVATMMAIASRLKPTEAERAQITRMVEEMPRQERERYAAEIRYVRRSLVP